MAMAASRSPGVWICASVNTSCDQTVATIVSLERFYPVELPLDLATPLRATLPRSRSARPAPIEDFAALFEPDSFERLRRDLPDSPAAARLMDSRAGSSPAEYLGWMLHQHAEHDQSRQWGALEFLAMDYEFLPPLPGALLSDDPGEAPDYFTLQGEALTDFMAASLAHCATTLDAIEAAFGLPAPALSLFNGEPVSGAPAVALAPEKGPLPRWGDDWPPSCLRPELLGATEALLERSDIESAALAARPARASRLI